MDLNGLVERGSSRTRSNLAAMRAMTNRLDDPIFAPSEAPDPASERRSTQAPMPGSSDDAGDPLRDRLPRRSDPLAGGDYGASILTRVARNYGIE